MYHVTFVQIENIQKKKTYKFSTDFLLCTLKKLYYTIYYTLFLKNLSLAT